jgi:hypothetical protein
MSRMVLHLALSGIAFSCICCDSSSLPTSPSLKPSDSHPAAAATAFPAEVQAAAEDVLGEEAEILAYGDLAKTGNDQLLAVNRLKPTSQEMVPGTLITRMAVLEKSDGKWKELLRGDEYLKNSKGYLGGTPLAGVPAWRLQYEQEGEKGLVMYFTPVAQPAGAYMQTIGVRWNPRVKRYESLDRNYQQFLVETEQLETPQSVLR